MNEFERGVRKAFESFMSDEAGVCAAIDDSTSAGYGGGSCKLELLPDGTFRILWDGQIGNLYNSPGIIIAIPSLTPDEIGDDELVPNFYDNAIEALVDVFEASLDRALECMEEAGDEDAPAAAPAPAPAADDDATPASFNLVQRAAHRPASESWKDQQKTASEGGDIYWEGPGLYFIRPRRIQAEQGTLPSSRYASKRETGGLAIYFASEEDARAEGWNTSARQRAEWR